MLRRKTIRRYTFVDDDFRFGGHRSPEVRRQTIVFPGPLDQALGFVYADGRGAKQTAAHVTGGRFYFRFVRRRPRLLRFDGQSVITERRLRTTNNNNNNNNNSSDQK